MSSRAGGGADSLSSTASKDDEEDNSKNDVASLPCGICSVDLIGLIIYYIIKFVHGTNSH
jgi:hypothetical protein